ncbi:MAG: hypothetical protein ACXWUG_20680 [Polyangiales bacterium]
MRRALVAIAFLLSACQSTPLTAVPAPETRPSAAKAEAPNVGPRVLVRNGAKPGEVEIVAQSAVELDARLFVEHQLKDGHWEPLVGLDLDSMKLVESCAQKVGACVSLEAKRVLRPVPWSGMSCSSQCNGSCDKNVYRAGMPHRFVVTTCDGKERFEGPAFDLPAK